MVKAVQRIEALGYDSIWFADHLVIPRQDSSHFRSDVWPEPVTLAAYLAAHTERVRIGWDVLVTTYRSPFFLAKSLATLDVLTEGRVIAGLAAGYLEREFAALGVPFKERGAMTDEHIRVMKALWTEDPVSFSGRYYAFSDVHALPKPVQQPHPPIWIGGNSRPAMRRAVKLGQGWHSLHPKPEELKSCVAYLRQVERTEGRKQTVVSYSCPWMRITDKPLGQDRPSLSGSAAQVTEDFRALERLGVSYAAVRFGLASKDGAETLHDLEAFATQVMPKFKA